MKRRTFLKITSGTLAAAGISSILKAQDIEEKETLTYKDNARNIEYTASFYASAIRNLSGVDIHRRTVNLKVVNAGVTGEYAVQLSTSAPSEALKNVYNVKGGNLTLISGKESLPANFPQPFSAQVLVSSTPSLNYMAIKNGDGSTFITLIVSSTPSDDWDDDCFLTSTCVKHKGLPDNCHELETLRAFRDNYMRPLPEGRLLVEGYYEKGPQVLGKINAHPQAPAIYDHIYHTLVLPSIALIEDGKHGEAMMYYRDYVLELERQLILE